MNSFKTRCPKCKRTSKRIDNTSRGSNKKVIRTGLGGIYCWYCNEVFND